MKQQSLVDTGSVGTCVVRAKAPPRVQVRAQPQVRPRTARAGKPKEDGAVWLMRFLAFALVLLVMVLLVFHT